MCKDVFEHLLEPIYTLSEIKRVLKPGGFMLFHVPNHFPLYGRLKFLVTGNIDTFSFFREESRWTFPHIRFYEQVDTYSIFKSNGFEVVMDLSYHFHIVPLLSRIEFFSSASRVLASRWPNQFAAGYTLLVKKH